ncbi:MAG TPA: hypothetical protein VF198_11835 [Vicinamibacterales bacterium]
MDTIFLLSPAHCGGRRAALLLRPESTLPMAARLRRGELPLGEAFTFMSGLYFRGKLAYARAFGRGPDSRLVITPTRGLLSPDTPVSDADIREFASLDVAEGGARFRDPLLRDTRALAERYPEARVVLLGSVATSKYLDVLDEALGERLCFPSAFIGRGDMSRGGLMLRCVEAGTELEYIALRAAATRRGPRPEKLPPRSGKRGTENGKGATAR